MDNQDVEIPVPLRPDERLEVVAQTDQGTVAVTDQRVIVASEHYTAIDVPLDHIRRVEFDIDRGRPPTLILVPIDPRWAPQVLTVPEDQVPAVLRALALILDRVRQAPE